jgi:hypothetical protein
MTRRIEGAMALLRRGDPSVTEVCFAVGCSSLGTFSSRFIELVGVPPTVYRRQAARFPADEASDGHPRCIGPPRPRKREARRQSEGTLREHQQEQGVHARSRVFAGSRRFAGLSWSRFPALALASLLRAEW